VKGVTEFDKCFNKALLFMWECSTGNATTPKARFVGAQHFARFILSELDREQALAARGETALARRGLAASRSILSAWVWNVVEDCSKGETPLPPEMLEVLYRLLGCSHQVEESEPTALDIARQEFVGIEAHEPGLPTRELARRLNVNASTVSRWRKIVPPVEIEADEDLYLPIVQMTGVDRFMDASMRAMEPYQAHRHNK
jgi:DNA-binding transcriptional regulator YiaG